MSDRYSGGALSAGGLEHLVAQLAGQAGPVAGGDPKGLEWVGAEFGRHHAAVAQAEHAARVSAAVHHLRKVQRHHAGGLRLCRGHSRHLHEHLRGPQGVLGVLGARGDVGLLGGLGQHAAFFLFLFVGGGGVLGGGLAQPLSAGRGRWPRGSGRRRTPAAVPSRVRPPCLRATWRRPAAATARGPFPARPVRPARRICGWGISSTLCSWSSSTSLARSEVRATRLCWRPVMMSGTWSLARSCISVATWRCRSASAAASEPSISFLRLRSIVRVGAPARAPAGCGPRQRPARTCRWWDWLRAWTPARARSVRRRAVPGVWRAWVSESAVSPAAVPASASLDRSICARRPWRGGRRRCRAGRPAARDS